MHGARPPPPSKGSRGRRKRRRGHSLALRLRDSRDGVLRLARDPAVPAPDNEAERALRPLKVRQRISGSLRSEAGARNHAALRTVLDTARKQGWNLLETLRTAPEELAARLAARQPDRAGRAAWPGGRPSRQNLNSYDLVRYPGYGCGRGLSNTGTLHEGLGRSGERNRQIRTDGRHGQACLGTFDHECDIRRVRACNTQRRIIQGFVHLMPIPPSFVIVQLDQTYRPPTILRRRKLTALDARFARRPKDDWVRWRGYANRGPISALACEGTDKGAEQESQGSVPTSCTDLASRQARPTPHDRSSGNYPSPSGVALQSGAGDRFRPFV